MFHTHGIHLFLKVICKLIFSTTIHMNLIETKNIYDVPVKRNCILWIPLLLYSELLHNELLCNELLCNELFYNELFYTELFYTELLYHA